MSGLREALKNLAEDWRYKSEDLQPWQEGGGPSPDEAAFDQAAADIRKLLNDYPEATPTAPPVASRDRVAEAVDRAAVGIDVAKYFQSGDLDRFVDALLAAGVFRDAATVKDEALREAAAALYGDAGPTAPARRWSVAPGARRQPSGWEPVMTADKPMTPPGGPGQTAGVYAIQSFNEGIARLADLLKSHPELVWVRAMADTAGHVDIIVDAGTGVLHNWVHALPAARRKQDLFSIHSGAAIEEVLIDGSLTVHVRPRGGGTNEAQLGVVKEAPCWGRGPTSTGGAS